MYMHVKSIHNTVIIYKYLSYNMISANKIKKKTTAIYLLNIQNALLQINRQGGQKKNQSLKKIQFGGEYLKIENI